MKTKKHPKADTTMVRISKAAMLILRQMRAVRMQRSGREVSNSQMLDELILSAVPAKIQNE